MTDTTQPGGFTPGINLVFADGYCAASEFCNLVLVQVREVLPALHLGASYTLRALCDPQVWHGLTPSEHQEAGRIMVRLVAGGWLPLRAMRLPAQVSKEIHAGLMRDRRPAASGHQDTGVAGREAALRSGIGRCGTSRIPGIGTPNMSGPRGHQPIRGLPPCIGPQPGSFDNINLKRCFMRITLNQSVVDTELRCPDNRRKIEFPDSDGVRGLFIEVRLGSTDHTYYVRWKDPNGKACQTRIGRTSQISLADARKEARKLKAQVILGANPQQEARAKRATPLYAEFFEQRYLPYVFLRKRSAKRDRELYESRIKPAIGNLRLTQITRERIQALHSAVAEEGLAASTANHHVRVIRYSLNLAVEWGLLEKNPASKIPLFHEDNVVNNLLDDAQLQSLLTVLRTDRNRTVCQIALFLMSTGARLSEALSAKWTDVSLDKRSFVIKASNSKSKRLRAVPLSDSAMEVLLALPTRGEHEYLFVNSRTDKPYVQIAKQWARIRKVAGVPFLRIHDLRHAFASFLVSNGVSLWTVSTLLGHSNPQISTRYAHLTTAALQSAVNVASLKITGGDVFAGMAKADQ